MGWDNVRNVIRASFVVLVWTSVNFNLIIFDKKIQ